MQTIDRKIIKKIINNALDEDIGSGDITCNLTLNKDRNINFTISNRQKIILCGVDIAILTFEILQQRLGKTDHPLKLIKHYDDKAQLDPNCQIITGAGSARLIFAAERVALNLLQHLSSIATKANYFVKILNNDQIKILDTRKTIPNLRVLQKYAVKIGGAFNHRFGLFDMVMIKDNHIAACGSISKAVSKVKSQLTDSKIKIEVECDNLSQVKEAAQSGVDIILLDNMDKLQIIEAIKIINKKCQIEVSGGVDEHKIKQLRDLKIDFISIGALTHSFEAADIGLDIV